MSYLKFNWKPNKEKKMIILQTPVGFSSGVVVDLIVIIANVSGGTWKFGGKSTFGDLSDGGTTAVGLGVVLVVDGAPGSSAAAAGVVVVVALVDGIVEVYSSDLVSSG